MTTPYVASCRWLAGLALFAALLPGTLRAGTDAEAPATPAPAAPADTPFILKKATQAIQADLDALDQALAEAARQLSATDLTNSAARAILAKLYTAHTGVVLDVCTVNPNGIMLAVEPEAFRRAEGADISRQEHVQELLATRQPVMSRLFRTVEGLDAVDIEHPVRGTNQAFLGSVSAIFHPATLMGRRAPELLAGAPVELWAMQSDGRILYDADPAEIGRLLFSDPAYQPFPELLQLGFRMAREPEGAGAYSFFRDNTLIPVPKYATWATLGLHGTAWRLVLTHVDRAAIEAAKARAEAAAAPKPFTDNDLRRLTRDLILLRALDTGDKPKALQRLQQIASGRSDIYSLSWIDDKGVNRFGYPPENSLTDVNLRTAEDAASKACVAAIESRREASFEGELVEGGKARFFLVPILQGRNYRGALLWIRKQDAQVPDAHAKPDPSSGG